MNIRIQYRFLLLFFACTVGACQSLPDNNAKPSYRLVDRADTELARHFQAQLEQRAGFSGVYPLADGVDAFVARLGLVQAAQKSLDLQYYIWHDDDVGRLLLAYLLNAADRGVRVRLLLDDVGSPLGDEGLLRMDMHPNIEVRLFNPLGNRARRLWSMLTEFQRTNRRMHNKSITADNTITIVGGRNIGDEYFDAHGEVAFADLDVMAIGPVVDQVSAGFDLYWNYHTTYPVQLLSHNTFNDDVLAQARLRSAEYLQQAASSEYITRLLQSELVTQKGVSYWYWGKAQVLYDHPAKALSSTPDESVLLSAQLSSLFNDIESELLLVSPYFVPGKEGVKFFKALREQGVQVTIITNSLAATDVGAVHSGYAKYRKDLLAMGVALYEIRPDAGVVDDPVKKKKSSAGIGSSSQASLHAKAFFIDRKKTFIGSMNLDPRSFYINTEIGVVVDSTAMTAQAFDTMLESISQHAYQLLLDESGDLIWVEQEADGPVYYHREPQVSALRRLGVWLLGLFPIESQL
jgi:putative cardiolipin synthase